VKEAICHVVLHRPSRRRTEADTMAAAGSPIARGARVPTPNGPSVSWTASATRVSQAWTRGPLRHPRAAASCPSPTGPEGSKGKHPLLSVRGVTYFVSWPASQPSGLA
jgi:hypothetical protein